MLHRARPEILAGVWIALRETLVVGAVPRRRKERIATAISELNRCPYCVDAHRIMLAATTGGVDDRAADREISWARSTLEPGAEILARPPFGEREGPELRGTAFCFHYINRMVTLLLGDSPLPLGGWLRRPIALASSLYFARVLRRRPRPGVSLALLPPSSLPSQLSWASESPVAEALARFTHSIERSVESEIEPEDRERVVAHLRGWLGAPPPIGSGWLVEALGGEGSPRARLALLAARAPHRVGATEIEMARGDGDDGELLAVLSWGSLRAALRIAEWI
jgi:AhpD family alkylhydroperoxidase